MTVLRSVVRGLGLREHPDEVVESVGISTGIREGQH